jgi:hypothetical protein
MSSVPISSGPKTTYAVKDHVKRRRNKEYAALHFLGWVEKREGDDSGISG